METPPTTTTPPTTPASVTKNKLVPNIITYYFHPFTAAFYVILQLAYQKIPQAITQNDYLFVFLFISIFVVYFVGQYHLLKFLYVRKNTKLRKKLWFDLYLCLFMTCNNFIAFYPLDEARLELDLVTCMLYSMMLVLWIIFSCSVIGDLVECWKIRKNVPEENIVQTYSHDAAGNVVGGHSKKE